MYNEEILRDFLDEIDKHEEIEIKEKNGEITVLYTKDKINQKTGEKEEEIIEISTFLIPVKETIHITNEEQYAKQSLYLYHNGTLSGLFELDPVSVYNKFNYMKRFGGKTFCEFSMEKWPIFFELYNIALKEVPVKEIYEGMGWLENNSKFLYGNFVVSQDTILRCMPEQNDEVFVVNRQEACIFVSSIIENLSNNKFAIISIVLFYFLSLLKLRFYEAYRFSPMFSLAVIGETGSRKTSTVLPMANPMGNKEFESNFTDSLAQITKKYKSNVNGCTIVDDFKTNSAQNNEKFEKILRLCGDDSSNAGVMCGGKLDETVTTGLAVFTGEEHPQLQESSFPRMLILRFEKETINNDVLTKLTDNIEVYISFILAFIQHIMSISDFDNSFVSKVKSERKRYAEITADNRIHGRYCEMLAWMSVMWDYMKDFFSSNGVDLNFDYRKELLSHIIRQHNKFVRDPVTLFVRAFFDLKDSNTLRVIDYSQKDSCDFDALERTDEYFIKKGAVFKKVIKLLSAEGIELNITEKALLKKLKEQGLIGTHRSNLNTH